MFTAVVIQTHHVVKVQVTGLGARDDGLTPRVVVQQGRLVASAAAATATGGVGCVGDTPLGEAVAKEDAREAQTQHVAHAKSCAQTAIVVIHCYTSYAYLTNKFSKPLPYLLNIQYYGHFLAL